MRKLELHVNDMDFLVNELTTKADTYEMLHRTYIEGAKTAEEPEKSELRELAKEFRRRSEKCKKIVDAMRDQGVYFR